ncbi:hypothetical protein AGMMS49975_07330 [Clostridia bacterium]|nr:hypothetical protein AGMMS49975_07330 [Clostridia bacterium]
MLFATDLDNTLIHSYKHKKDGDICVERKDGRELSFMPPLAYEMLQGVSFVPVTTRSLEQYERVKLLRTGTPEYAITSNGAALLRNGEIDKKWHEDAKNSVNRAELDFYIEKLKNDNILDTRLVDEVYIFTKSKDIAAALRRLDKFVDKSVYDITSLYEKIYIVPKSVNKGTALKKLSQGEKLICAGDSVMDLSMLLIADIALVPQNFPFTSENFVFADSDSFAEFVLNTIMKY